MKTRSIYTILGAVVGAVVDLLINLVAAGVQQHAFANQFSIQSILGLVGLASIGLLVRALVWENRFKYLNPHFLKPILLKSPIWSL